MGNPSQEETEKARKLNALFVKTIDSNWEMVDIEIVGEFMSDIELAGQSILFNTPQDIVRWCTLVPLFAALFFRGSLGLIIRTGHPAQWNTSAEENRRTIEGTLSQMGGIENLEKMSLEELGSLLGAELVRIEEHLLSSPGSAEKKIIVVRKGTDNVFRKVGEFYVNESGTVRL